MLLPEEHQRIFEGDLAKLSSRIDPLLRREFANERLIRFVTIPKPRGCLASLFRQVVIGAGIGVIGWWIWDHWALWFHQPYHAYTWPRERYELIGKIVGQLLQELDGIASQSKRIFVLAATNAPESIDPALRSRFPGVLEIPLPDVACRTAILSVLLQQKPLNFDAGQVLPQIAAYYDRCSGRDLRSLVERAEERAVGRALANGTPSAVRIEVSDLE